MVSALRKLQVAERLHKTSPVVLCAGTESKEKAGALPAWAGARWGGWAAWKEDQEGFSEEVKS